MSGEGDGLATSAPENGVSAMEHDSLECVAEGVSSAVAQSASAACNQSLGLKSSPTPQSLLPTDEDLGQTRDRQPSLQELIEAELTARLAPLQPDSLEALITRESHEHIRTTVNGSDVTNTCTTLLDSLETSQFSLDSLAEAESDVNPVTSPKPPVDDVCVNVPLKHDLISDDVSNNNSSCEPKNPPFFLNESSPSKNETVLDSNLMSEVPRKISQTKPTLETHDPVALNENVVAQNLCSTSKTNDVILDHVQVSSDKTLDIDVVSENLINSNNDVDFVPEAKTTENPGVNDVLSGDVPVCENAIETEVISNKENSSDIENTEEELCVIEGSLRASKNSNSIEITVEQLPENAVVNETKRNIDDSTEGSEVVETIQTEDKVSSMEAKTNPEEESKNKTTVDKNNYSETSADVPLVEVDSVSNAISENGNDAPPAEEVEVASEALTEYVEEVQLLNEDSSQLSDLSKETQITEKSTDIEKIEDNIHNDQSEVKTDINEINGDVNNDYTKANGHHEEISDSEKPLTNGDTDGEKPEIPGNTQKPDSLIQQKISLTNSYNIIGVAKDVTSVNVNKKCPLNSANLTNGACDSADEEELWPDEEGEGGGDPNAGLDEFQKMEQELLKEIEEEEDDKKKKKKKREVGEGDKKGKKKKKRKSDAEKENKNTSSSIQTTTTTTTCSESTRASLSSTSETDEELLNISSTEDDPTSAHRFLLRSKENIHMMMSSTPKRREETGSLDGAPEPKERSSRLSRSSEEEGKERKAEERELSVSSNTSHGNSFDEDDLSNISVKQLKASYLSVTEKKTQQRRSPSPGVAAPIRSRTPISQLKSAYESSVNDSKSGSSNETIAPKDEVNVSLSQLREAYCSVASTANEKGTTSPRCVTPSRHRTSKTASSFRNMRASYEDLPRTLSQVDISTRELFSPSSHSSTGDSSFSKSLSRTPRRADGVTNDKTLNYSEPTQISTECRMCGKQVFQMEKIVAEKASWHKNCFKCKECNKSLTLETYQSHEGSLYCKPHFKELFRPKAVLQDEAEERKDRSTEKPDYGLEELQQALNVKERFAVFENLNREENKPKPEPVSVRRSQSLMSKAAKFLEGHDDRPYGDPDEEYEEDEEEDEEEEGEEEEEYGEDGEERVVKSSSKKKKERPMSFSGMGDLKAAWEQKQRREEMSQSRKEEITRFRQMLCAGKNVSLKEKFESGVFDDEENEGRRSKEEIKIEGKRAASNLKKRFEQGEPFILEDEDEDDEEEEEDEEEEGGEEEGEERPRRKERRRRSRIGSEKQEVEEIFKEAETAKKARNVFKQIDSKVAKEGTAVLRSQSFASSNRENRNSIDGLQGADDLEVLGRDPNLIKCTDNYQDEVDCRNTKNILQMFKKMEMGDEEEEDEEGPRPMKRFTPPPGAEEYDSEEEEYSDEEYSDEEEEEDEEESDNASKVRDELLQMQNTPSQSARKAASLRAKFERWEAEVARQNDLNKDKDDLEECMPSLDTTKNLKAMFEHKAEEVAKPVTSKPIIQKVNRFVGGGGDKCVACDKTVYVVEKLEIHGKVLHKNCFKCFKCNTKLSMGSFSFGGGDHMYCTTHYKQLFTEKGSYDAFTSEKGKWTRKIEAMNGEIKSHD